MYILLLIKKDGSNRFVLFASLETALEHKKRYELVLKERGLAHVRLFEERN